MKSRFQGTGVALVTPFHKQGNVDFTSLGKLVEHVIQGGVDYLVCLGTTSETITLGTEEKKAVLNFIIEANNSRLPIVAGIGGSNTFEIQESLREFDLSKVDAILSVAPYYNKPQQKGIYQHFKVISESTSKPIILYNVPGRTSSNINAETTLQLAEEFKNIVAIKEASGNFDQGMEIIKHKPKDFQVLSGDDALTLPLISVGFTGVISVVANAIPNQFSNLVNLAMEGDFTKARELHYKLLEFSNLVFEEGNPSGIKSALESMGIIQNYLRLPLVRTSKSLHNKIENSVKEIFKGNLPVK